MVEIINGDGLKLRQEVSRQEKKNYWVINV